MSSGDSRRYSSIIPAERLGTDPWLPSRFAGPAAVLAGIVTIITVGVRVLGLLPKHHLILLSLTAVTDLLIVITLVGLWRRNACGNGRAAKIGLGLAVFGYLLDVPGELLTTTSRRTAMGLSGGGSLLFALGMIVAGISMLMARRWHGWHRLVPVVLGAFFPLVIIPSIILRRGPDVAFTLLGVLYVLLGLAVRSEQNDAGQAPVLPPAHASG